MHDAKIESLTADINQVRYHQGSQISRLHGVSSGDESEGVDGLLGGLDMGADGVGKIGYKVRMEPVVKCWIDQLCALAKNHLADHLYNRRVFLRSRRDRCTL
jgi:hypothetical protein